MLLTNQKLSTAKKSFRDNITTRHEGQDSSKNLQRRHLKLRNSTVMTNFGRNKLIFAVYTHSEYDKVKFINLRADI